MERQPSPASLCGETLASSPLPSSRQEGGTKAKHWLAVYGQRVPAEIDSGAHGSVVAMLEGAMKRYADKLAFHCLGQTLTYADTDRLSRCFTAYLQCELGVKKGERIAVMLPNIPAFPLAMLGIVRAGAVQVNVNPLYTPRELEHQLNDAGVEIIIIFSGVSATLAEVAGVTPLKRVISVGLYDGTGIALPSAAVDARLDNVVAFSDALAKGADLAFTPVPLSGDDLLFLQYTGGTTGLSKGAALSHRNLIANTEQFKAFIGDALRPGEDVVVTALPLYHVFALMVNFISYYSVGAENWLVPNPRDLDGFVDILKDARCSVFTGVNTLFGGLLMHPGIREVDFSNLRLAIGGGAAVLPITSEKWKALTGKHILEGYGLSETSPILTLNPVTGAGFSATVGLPLPSTDVKLLDDNDNEVAIGEAGGSLRQGPTGDERLLAEPGSYRCRFHHRRLLPHRGHRYLRRRGLPQDRRPQEGHDPRLGLQRLPERDRGGRCDLRRNRRMRLRRGARRDDRRSGEALPGQGAGSDCEPSRGDRALSAAACGIQGAQAGALPGSTAQIRRR